VSATVGAGNGSTIGTGAGAFGGVTGARGVEACSVPYFSSSHASHCFGESTSLTERQGCDGAEKTDWKSTCTSNQAVPTRFVARSNTTRTNASLQNPEKGKNRCRRFARLFLR
jgi:hypothetical protein